MYYPIKILLLLQLSLFASLSAQPSTVPGPKPALSSAVGSAGVAAVADVSKRVVLAGEELIYDVRFMAIKLGSIKLITLPDTVYQLQPVHHSKVLIQSNPNIPFYSLKAIFNALMDTSFRGGRHFEANTKERTDAWGFQKIAFGSKSISNRKWYDNKLLNDTTYATSGKVFDGSTLLYFARRHSGQSNVVNLLTIMDLSIGTTMIKFTDRLEKTKISAIDYPIKTFYLEGSADWQALYGLGGKFQGWFSADGASVPIKATMNVYLGNITIELRSWKRAGWEPPKF